MYNSYMEEFNYDVQKNDIPEDEAKMIAENSYAYYIFPQDQKDLREQVDKALKELKEDGTLTEISKNGMVRMPHRRMISSRRRLTNG